MQLNKIYLGDCLEVMKRIPDGSIDMILCDLPYGVTKIEWDSKIPFPDLWQQYQRVIKDNGAIVLTAIQPFTTDVINSNRANYRYCWYWIKNNVTGFVNAKRQPMRCVEDVVVFYKKPPTYNPQGLIPVNIEKENKNSANSWIKVSGPTFVQDFTGYPRQTLAFKRDKDIVHPTQKPVALFEYLIRTYTNEGETVLDNCLGSGTTAVAAINTGRNFIGIERELKYYDAATNRVKRLNRM